MKNGVRRVIRYAIWIFAIGTFAAVLQARSQNATPAQPAPAAPPAAAAPAVAPARAAAPVPGDIASYKAGVVDRYCIGCHSERLKTANLVLQGLDLANEAAKPEVYDTLEKMVRKLRAGAMPPQGSPRPDEATMEAFITTLEGSLDKKAELGRNPGRTETFHRLNRAEYQNAIRDVLALDIDVTELLPQDESSFGFDNIASVLRLSHTFMERYTSAASKIARLSVGSPNIPAGEVETLLTSDMSQARHLEGLPLGTRGGALIRHWVPLDAEYDFTIELLENGDEGPAETAFESAHTIEVSIDGERAHVYTYPTRPRLGGRGRGGAGAGGRGDAVGEAVKRHEGLKVRLPLTAGPHDIAVTFPKKTAAMSTFARNWFEVPWFTGAGFNTGSPLGTAYVPFLGSVVIAGPFNPTGPGDTPSRRKIFSCQPAGKADEPRCGRQILSALARHAYRRPVSAADLQPLTEFFDQGRTGTGGTFQRGIELAVQRMLVSPEFLFRIERQPATVAKAANYRINNLELASRLSFFLWSSVPDDALLTAAEKGTLSTPAVLAQQVRRMLADAKSDAFVRNFTGQWLYVRNVPRSAVDAVSFPDFEAGLRKPYQKETELFFADVLRNPKASALELLSADYTYLNEALARHYGIANVYGEYYRKVALTNGERLGGLLGHGSVLMATSQPNRTAPTIRGKFILGTFLGTPPPEPPPNIPALAENQAGGEQAPRTVRERLAQHRRNPACAGCHNLMDPIGLSLENYDAIGRWRVKGEDGSPIDSAVTLFDGSKLNSPADLRAALLKHKDNVLRTLTERILTYALGRGVEYYDYPTIRKIVREAPGQSLESLILGIVSSEPFQMRRAES